MKYLTSAIIIKDKKMLLVYNIKHEKVRIETPGGKIEENETPEECAARESFEELGIKIRVKELLGKYGTNTPEGYFESYMFITEIVEGEPEVKAPDEISKFGWYSKEEIEEFIDKGLLVPNLIVAFEDLKKKNLI